jgi:hypothetical protein
MLLSTTKRNGHTIELRALVRSNLSSTHRSFKLMKGTRIFLRQNKSVVLGAPTNESVLTAEDDLVEFGGKSDGEGLGKQLGVT